MSAMMLFASARNFASQVVWDPEGGNQHDPENLQFLAQIPRHLLPLIGTMRPAPSEFLFDASDSMLAGRTLFMNIWAVHNKRQGRNEAPHQGSTLFALHFPFKICNLPIVRYYSFDSWEKIWFFCQTVAQKYGIDTNGYNNLDMHPIHRLVECCFACNKKPTPLILTIPMDLSNRQQYLVWMELFMRDIYELLLDGSYKSLGTTSWDLSFGYLEHNASATGTFRATAIVRPITGWGRTFNDDFAIAEFTELPRKKMAVVIRTTHRWMVNRHTNARPELVDHVGEALSDRLWSTESDEDCEDSQDSEAESEESQDSEAESEESQDSEENSVMTEKTLSYTRDSETDTSRCSLSPRDSDSATDAIAIPIELATEVRDVLSSGLRVSESDEVHDVSQDSESKSEVKWVNYTATIIHNCCITVFRTFSVSKMDTA